VAPPIGLNVSRVYRGEAGRNRRVLARAAFGCRFKALSRELTMAGRIVSGLAVIAALAEIGVSAANAQTGAAQITLLYDAFGKTSTLTKDWGFAALIEYGGKRILFDTGNNAEIFAHNVEAAGIDLKQLDFVVISHRHGDHTSGLNYLLKVNPEVKIYVPQENFGVFGAALPGTFYRRNDSLPADMRYFGGKPPDALHKLCTDVAPDQETGIPF